MNTSPILYYALRNLNESMKGSLSGTQIENIKDTINGFAIASAIACMAAGIIPGVAGVVAALTQAGFVWTTYVKINKTLGISMSENTTKFIGSAILTNLITNAGALLLLYAGAAIISLVPFLGQAGSAAINGVIGYICVYTAAIIYLKLITKMVQPNGTLKVDASEDTKHIIEELIKDTNLKEIIQEGRNAYKQAKADGSFDKAKQNPQCPNCNAKIKVGQKYCSECGMNLQ